MSRTSLGQSLSSIVSAHHGAEAAAQHALLDRLEQVVGLELLDRHLGVAGDAEGVGARRLVMPGNSSSRLAAMSCSSQTKS